MVKLTTITTAAMRLLLLHWLAGFTCLTRVRLPGLWCWSLLLLLGLREGGKEERRGVHALPEGRRGEKVDCLYSINREREGGKSGEECLHRPRKEERERVFITEVRK